MKTLSQILMITSFCIGTCYLQSCVDPLSSEQKCNDTVTETRNISSDDLSKIPYKGFDTLYFLNKQGDTCIVRGTGKKFSYETSYDNGNPACPPPHKYLDQLYTIEFVSLKGNLGFVLTQKRSPERIYIDRPSYNVIFDRTSSSIDYKNLSNPLYIDAINIKGKVYERNSIFLGEIRNEIEVYDSMYKLIYNKPYGILYIQSTKQNEEFSLIPNP